MNTDNVFKQMEAWFDGAYTGKYEVGDTIISNEGFDTYSVSIANHAGTIPKDDTQDRILERAPKPAPAWHGAVAVIAEASGFERQVWEREGSEWYGTDGYRLESEALSDVVPLIEARVTDGMVLAAINASLGLTHERLDQYNQITIEDMRAALHAALGVDPA